jgi:hypothetical protein
MTAPAPLPKKTDPDLELLMQALGRRGVTVRYEACPGDGGLVRLHDELQLLLNPSSGPDSQKDVMLEALRKLGSGGGFIHPRLRRLLGENEWNEADG